MMSNKYNYCGVVKRISRLAHNQEIMGSTPISAILEERTIL